MKFYATFGSSHIHNVRGATFGFTRPMCIEAPDYDYARRMVFAAVGTAFCTIYTEEEFDTKYYSHFPVLQPDFNCMSMPDGRCVSTEPCMHGDFIMIDQKIRSDPWSTPTDSILKFKITKVVLVYENGLFAGMDQGSGGYPFPTDSIFQAHMWSGKAIDEMDRYVKMFSELSPRIIVIDVNTIPYSLTTHIIDD